MQNDFVLQDSPFRIAGALATVPVIAAVLERFRKKVLPVFHIVREYRADGSDIEKFRYKAFVEGGRCAVPGSSGCEIVTEISPVEGEYRIVKNRFSGFMNTELDFMLRRLGVEEVVIVGTQYPNCVRATAYDAVAYGYDVTILTDATSAVSEEIARENIVDLSNIGIRCITSSAI
jgi:nicotinamidase-related amidase